MKRRTYNVGGGLDPDLVFYAPFDRANGNKEILSGKTPGLMHGTHTQYDDHYRVDTTRSGSIDATFRNCLSYNTIDLDEHFPYEHSQYTLLLDIMIEYMYATAYRGPRINPYCFNDSNELDIIANIKHMIWTKSGGYRPKWGELNTWYKLAVTYSDDTHRADSYKDGIFQYSILNSYLMGVTSFYIQDYRETTNSHVIFNLRNVMMFKRVLTLDEIKKYQKIE